MDHTSYCAQFAVPPEKILDVGSGRGKFLVAMAKLGFEAHGLENNPAYNAEARAAAISQGVRAEIQEGSAEQLPYADNSFKFVNCAEVTEHVNDPIKVCGEIFRTLKPRGKCYISFQNRYGFYDYHFSAYLVNWLPRAWATAILKLLGKEKQDSPAIGRQRLETMHAYTYSQALFLLKKIGFTVYDIRQEKIKKKFGMAAPLFLVPYFVLRFCYFNTFHLLLEK